MSALRALKDMKMKVTNITALSIVTVAAVMDADSAVVPMAEVMNGSPGG
jgi:hypothetical protein